MLVDDKYLVGISFKYEGDIMSSKIIYCSNQFKTNGMCHQIIANLQCYVDDGIFKYVEVIFDF